VFGHIGAGDYLYWDLLAGPRDDESALWRQHRLTVHSFARVTLDGDRLEVAQLQPKWLKAALADSRVEIAHTTVEGDVILTASPAELQELVRDHGDDEGAFGDLQVFYRTPADQ
jgi:hypothetical protein